ncbi:hypothetical protein ACQP0C_27265 [Nocardia sp. CA-129566]|uniref:hypothetical protein n=1 Tax=Nocardia sp. CA-129566 TaxID=3239976 RepID=UPI003D95E604
MHLAADGGGRGLAVLLTPGQAHDSPMLAPLLKAIAVPRLEGGPPRRNPEVVIADHAYSRRRTEPCCGANAFKP